jgi:hypothetical protein
MVIPRYSDRLQLMAGNDTSRDTVLSDIAVLLYLYVDYGSLPMTYQKFKALDNRDHGDIILMSPFAMPCTFFIVNRL